MVWELQKVNKIQTSVCNKAWCPCHYFLVWNWIWCCCSQKEKNLKDMQYVKPKRGSVNIWSTSRLYILTLGVKNMHNPTDFCSSPDSCYNNLDVKSSTGLQRPPMCPCNVRGRGRNHPVGTINTPDSAHWRQNGKLGVHFIIDSFLMKEETERESVTWQHLQLSGCVQSEF